MSDQQVKYCFQPEDEGLRIWLKLLLDEPPTLISTYEALKTIAFYDGRLLESDLLGHSD